MIIDLTRTIYHNMPVYPGDPEVSLKRIASIDADGYVNYQLNLSMHAGTHIDGLGHMLEHQPNISALPLEHMIGSGKKIKSNTPFTYENEAFLLIDTAENLSLEWVQTTLKPPLRGIILEVESPDDAPYAIHQDLFKKGIYLIEQATGFHQLPFDTPIKVYVIPLKIEADSSPCRVFVEI